MRQAVDRPGDSGSDDQADACEIGVTGQDDVVEALVKEQQHTDAQARPHPAIARQKNASLKITTLPINRSSGAS